MYVVVGGDVGDVLEQVVGGGFGVVQVIVIWGYYLQYVYCCVMLFGLIEDQVDWLVVFLYCVGLGGIGVEVFEYDGIFFNGYWKMVVNGLGRLGYVVLVVLGLF